MNDFPPCPRCGRTPALVQSETIRGAEGYCCLDCGFGMKPVRAKNGQSARDRAREIWPLAVAQYKQHQKAIDGRMG